MSELKRIKVSLNLRDPQRESLDIFSKICDTISMTKNPDLTAELEKVKAICPTLTNFERDFPSFCFALATGIGKTRLMGAMIAYLYYDKGVKNFFVMAPNLTIYNKLKKDFGDLNNPKYVFRGLDAFVQAPRIIDGDNYEEFRQFTNINNDITINVFNISKLNSDSKDSKGKPARIKRLNEVLGESYFDYLKNLPDLCIFMDESHHYHADKSFDVINELKPVLGVEVTATPQIQKGSKATPFKNVVYEYSLAHALNEKKFVKIPAVVTRKDFRPDQYTPEELEHEKLKDGIKLHISTREALDTYARTTEKKLIKPFVLVVAKDTTHSKELKEYLTSDNFFGGYYNKKVLEINSSQSGAEKDENINQLLNLESPDNETEIVIHVNMLKEGWDVNNLYTIIPLRASASETLTEQTIGRGLRLPCGDRTGIEQLDTLYIVSHDKYESIINIANDPNSLVRKVYYIDPDDNPNEEQKETVALPSSYDEATTSASYVEQLSFEIITPFETTQEIKKDIAKIIATETNKIVMELHKHVKNIGEIKSQEMMNFAQKSVMSNVIKQVEAYGVSRENIINCIKKAVEEAVQALTDHVIPIPQAVIQPITEIKQYYDDFDLDTRNLNFHPSDETTLIATQLQEGGKTTEIDISFANINDADTPENTIIMLLIQQDNIDYDNCADLMYKLIEQAKKHFRSYLKSDKEVALVLKQFKVNIANNIYSQMNQHFYHEEVAYSASEMHPFTKIETGFGGKFISDDIHDYRASMSPSEVPKRIFKGFNKSCHTMYKFDSNTERIFATVLENDKSVLRWLCPNIRQFNIYYERNSSSKYQPDFIVETTDCIYMVETKDSRKVTGEIDDIVLAKAKAAIQYCNSATEYNTDNGGKPWKYILISSSEVKVNSSLKFLINNSVNCNND